MNLEETIKRIKGEGWQWLRLRKGNATLKGYGKKKNPLDWVEIAGLFARHGVGNYEIDVKELIGSAPTVFKVSITDEDLKKPEQVKPTKIEDMQPQTVYTPEIIEALKELERVKVNLQQQEARNEALEKLNKELNTEMDELEILMSQTTIDDTPPEPTTMETIALSLAPHVVEAAPVLLRGFADMMSNFKKPNNNAKNRPNPTFSKKHEAENDESPDNGRNAEYFTG